MDKSQYIGIVENTDPCFHLEIFDNLYDGNIIITKRLTDKLNEKLIQYKEKCILHLTVTGMGGSKVEPFVPSVEQSFKKFKKLIENGFPIEHVVLRIDPIVPTDKGINTALHVIDVFKNCGIKRVRFSVLDMYKHVKERFEAVGIPLPYETFHAPLEKRLEIRDKLVEIGKKDGFEVEACGEPGIESVSCLSQKDIDILGLTDKIKLEGNKGQRKSCSCPANKTQLYKNKMEHCQHGCLYCYIKD
jgi:DNA repair photolyase